MRGIHTTCPQKSTGFTNNLIFKYFCQNNFINHSSSNFYSSLISEKECLILVILFRFWKNISLFLTFLIPSETRKSNTVLDR